jgi:predicted HicB family RNase H-like nuclease
MNRWYTVGLAAKVRGKMAKENSKDKDKQEDVVLSVRLEPSTHRRLQELARNKDLSLAQVMRRALREYVKEA